VTRSDAIGYLRHWAFPGVVPLYVLNRLEAEALPDEAPLHTAARLAGVDITGVAPFDYAAILQRIHVAELENARQP
jgi:hypothetical protein